MEEHHTEHKKPKKKISIWKIISAVLAALLIISIFTSGFSSITNLSISKEEAKEKVLTFLKEGILSQASVSIVNIEDIGNLYKIKLEVNGNEYDSYLTKDAKLLFPSVIDITQKIEVPEPGEEEIPEEIPKTDKPKIELFVMSFCPFGNRAEDTMLPVYNLLKDKMDLTIHYIVNVNGDQIDSLHGQPEVDQDEREVCVLNKFGLDKWFVFTTYVNKNCGSDGSCWKDAAQEVKLDINKIEDCVNKEGLDLMKKEAEATDTVGATGSPTMIINGVISRAVYQYENPEAYKQAICSAFNNQPEECSEILTSNPQASAGGSC